MLATHTYNFFFILKLQLQLQFYLKTQRNKHRKKWLHISCGLIRFLFQINLLLSSLILCKCGKKNVWLTSLDRSTGIVVGWAECIWQLGFTMRRCVNSLIPRACDTSAVSWCRGTCCCECAHVRRDTLRRLEVCEPDDSFTNSNPHFCRLLRDGPSAALRGLSVRLSVRPTVRWLQSHV